MQDQKLGQPIGKQSIRFRQSVYLEAGAAVVGKKEGEGPLGQWFDKVEQDDKFGKETWEEGESVMQEQAAELAMEKAGLEKEQIRLIFAGDLLAQSMASSFGVGNFQRPVYGLFGACSTMAEGMGLGAMAVAGGFAEHVLVVTSSHFATAEKEFRFPLGYGNQRPLSASWTVTGSGACILGNTPSGVKISGITSGVVTDYGLKDNQNMGACMAPADERMEPWKRKSVKK